MSKYDDLVPLLREALQNLEQACEQLAATRTQRIYEVMIEDGQTEALISLDARRHAARDLLRRCDPERSSARIGGVMNWGGEATRE